MNTNEVFQELTTRWMNNAAASRVFGFTVGESFDNVYSQVSIIRLLFYVVASVIALKETKLKEWEDQVRMVAEDTHYGTTEWWKRKAVEFEPGKNLVVIDGKVAYETVDESARVVTAVTVIESGRVIEVKVAKGKVGNLMPLSEEELASFNGYLEEIKPLGLVVNGVSKPANGVELYGKITYEGELLKEDIEREVNEVVNRYLKNMEFGGTLYVGRLVGWILTIEGVVNADIERVRIDGVDVDGKAVPDSGYAVISNSYLTYESE